MTTFMDSAWYFLRFCDPVNESLPFSPAAIEEWMPVDYYVGGKEHAVGHLLYSRFVTIVLERAGLLRLSRADHAGLPELKNEPFRRLLNQGIVYKDGKKMSKSKGNVVSSDGLADEYGADTARLFSFFGGPYDMDLEWSAEGVSGCHRFLKRLWRLAAAVQLTHTTDENGDPIGAFNTANESPRDIDLEAMRARHKVVAGVSADIEAWRFNTAIAKMMENLNALEGLWKQAQGSDPQRAFTLSLLAMAQLLCPFAPHFSEELWSALGGLGLCCDSEWPKYDASALLENEIELPVQVNGKIRARITVSSDINESNAVLAAREDAQVQAWLEGKEIVKAMLVPGRLISFTVK
jgi:leucyl-tRNA synthetase